MIASREELARNHIMAAWFLEEQPRIKNTIRRVLATWKSLRNWQCTGTDDHGNTCATVVFEAHCDALLGLEAILERIDGGEEEKS